MATSRGYFKHLIFCCDLTSESILLIISLIIWFLGYTFFANWITYFCYYTFIPNIILVVLYHVASILLFCGVIFSSRGCIIAVPWILLACLFALIAYSILLYLGQQCICENITWAVSWGSVRTAITFEYPRLGFTAGVDFVVTFYMMLLTADYLDQDDCKENQPANGERQQAGGKERKRASV